MRQSKLYKAVYTLVMACLMSAVMSLVVTLLNLGWVDDLAWIWFKAWLFSVVIALPTMLLLTPLVEFLARPFSKRHNY